MNKNNSTRLLSLDVFRGLTIALMIIVNSPGNRFVYAWLEHSDWNGCTLADIVFPFFILIAAVSAVLAFTNLKSKGAANSQLVLAIIRRTIYLFGMGLILNSLPNHFDLSQLRIMGVLQRIAICYFFSSILFLTTSMRSQILILFVLLIGYWLTLTYFTTYQELTIENNLVGYIDRIVLLPQHLYRPWFDPEGLLSTIPAIATALLGNVLGYLLIGSRNHLKQLYWIVFIGIGLLILGIISNKSFPINKSLWTSSYVLWTGGLGFLVFAVCFALIEMKHWRSWSKPFEIFGKHAMLAYVLHVLFLKIQSIILVSDSNGASTSLRVFITNSLFGAFSAKNASLFYACTYTLFWLFIIAIIRFRTHRRSRLITPSEIK